MSVFTTFRGMICSAIAQRMPRLKKVAGHPGRFDLEELKRIALNAPSVRMAILGVPQMEEVSDERLRVHLSCALFVITRDAPGLPRDMAALNITEELIRMISLNQWGVTRQAGFGVLLPTRLQADNIYSAQIDRQGVAMWAISWRQTLILGESAFAPGDVLPAELYVRFGREDPQPHLLVSGNAGGADV